MIILGLFLLVAAAIIAMGFVLVNRALTNESGTGIIGGVVLALFGLVFAFVGLGFTEIGIGQVGVVSSFGKVEEQTLGPGLAWRTPFVTRVTVMDTKTQRREFDGIEAFSQEQQPAILVGQVNYRIDPERASALLQTVGDDYAQKLIFSQTDEVIKQVARSYPVDQMTAKRQEWGDRSAELLNEDLNSQGITIEAVVIRDVNLSQTYLDSITQRQVAQQTLERTRIEAEARRAQAQGEADATLIAAEGQAKANSALTQSLSPLLVQWQSIQKLNPNVTVMMIPSGAGSLINIPTPPAATP